MGSLEDLANAAKNLALTYDLAMAGYTHPDAIEADLAVLEDAIRDYRAVQAPIPRESSQASLEEMRDMGQR